MNRIHPSLPLACFALPLFLLAPQSANAIWPKDPGVNLPVCTATGNQEYAAIVSDGAGGAIITWEDPRSGSDDIYAQHLLASGAVDPTWPSDGRAVCTATSVQQTPQIVSDGAGGAIITWADYRGGVADVYVQHVLASGAVDPAWPADGRAVCTVAGIQYDPQLVSDGAGGAIITWNDTRVDQGDIYAQHVLASGAVDPAWPADGRAVCTATNGQWVPQLVSDGAGGAIITWADPRADVIDFNIYAQHVLASGAVDVAWPPDGRAVCAVAGSQYDPQLVSDGAGGAIISWADTRGGTYEEDIYAQHVLASGGVDVAWPSGGRAVCTAAFGQWATQLVSDGAGGAIITWNDSRVDAGDIYAHHVLASGAVDAAWPTDGRAVCIDPGFQDSPQLVSDGTGGAIITWKDGRASNWDIYAHHVLASGAVDAAWPTGGRAICTAANGQYVPQLASDGAGSAIITWQDTRAGSSDIYAQGVDNSGRLGLGTPLISSARDVPNDEGGKVKLSWHASSFDMDADPLVAKYWVYRSVPPNAARWGGVAAQSVLLGRQPMPGQLSKYVSTTSASATIFWEYVQEEDAFHFFDAYSALVPTTGDSLGPDQLNLTTEFMVVAMSADSSMYWLSPPVSGYSVDNISPPSPGTLRAEYRNDKVRIFWVPNSAPDVVSYRVYRGDAAAFGPSPENLVASVEAPEFTALAAGAPVFKVSAVDRNGNEGAPATLDLGLGIDSGAALTSVLLGRPVPSPAFARTRIAYALPRNGTIDLQVFDAGGHLVRKLTSGSSAAGEHFIDWDLRSDSGREVRAGLYFVKLRAEGKTLSRRLTVLH